MHHDHETGRYLKETFNYDLSRPVYCEHPCSEAMPISRKCESPCCPRHCHRWAWKKFDALMRGKDKDMYAIILPVGRLVPPPLLTRIWGNFKSKLRRLYPGCEWFWVLEYQNDNLHFHVVLKTTHPVTVEDIRDKWFKTLAKKRIRPHHSVKVDKIDENLNRLAAYLTKLTDTKHGPSYRPPPGLYRFLAYASPGFRTRLPERQYPYDAEMDLTAVTDLGAETDLSCVTDLTCTTDLNREVRL